MPAELLTILKSSSFSHPPLCPRQTHSGNLPALCSHCQVSSCLWHTNSSAEEVKRLEFRKPSVVPHNRPGSSLQSPNHPQPSLQAIFTTASHKGPGPQPTSLLTILSDDFLTSICMAPGTYKVGNTTFLALCVQQRPES